jgi:hypothetical protein
VFDWGLVVRARLLQHVIEHTGASWGRSRALAGRVDCEGLVLVVIVPLRVCIATGFVAPLLLLLELLGLATLRGRVVHTLALLAVEDGPHHLLAGSKTGGDVEQLVGVDRRASPKLAHEVPTGRALEEGVHDLRLSHAQEFSTALGKVSYEVPERFVGFWVHARKSQEFPRRRYVPWKFPTNVRTQVIPVVDLTGRQVLEPRPGRVCEMQWQVADDYFIGGGAAQLAC